MEFKQNTLERQATKLTVVKAKTLPHGQFEAVLSTDDLDRHGEHVSIKGMAIPKDQVIKMYYNHETAGMNLPIGKWLKVWKSDGKLMGLGEVDLEDDFAVKVYKKVLNGFIDSISVGFYPQEYDGETSTWTKSELVEASVVAEPANVNARITSKDLGFTQEEFTEALTVKLKQVTPDEQVDITETSSKDGAADLTEIKAAIDNLNSRQGALEEAFKAANENPTQKNLIKVRVSLKQVDQSVEKANQIVRVTLKETN